MTRQDPRLRAVASRFRRSVAALSRSVPATAADAVTESDVVIRMADGSCDAALFHPTGGGRWPGIVIFADALGLRPVFRDMEMRLPPKDTSSRTRSTGPAKHRC